MDSQEQSSERGVGRGGEMRGSQETWPLEVWAQVQGPSGRPGVLAVQPRGSLASSPLRSQVSPSGSRSPPSAGPARGARSTSTRVHVPLGTCALEEEGRGGHRQGAPPHMALSLTQRALTWVPLPKPRPGAGPRAGSCLGPAALLAKGALAAAGPQLGELHL